MFNENICKLEPKGRWNTKSSFGSWSLDIQTHMEAAFIAVVYDQVRLDVKAKFRIRYFGIKQFLFSKQSLLRVT